MKKKLFLAVFALSLVGNAFAMEAEKLDASGWYLTYLRFSDQLKKLDGIVLLREPVVQIYNAESYAPVATLQRITIDGKKSTRSSKGLVLEFLPSPKNRPPAQTVRLSEKGMRICRFQIDGQKKKLESYNSHGFTQLLFKSKGKLTFKGALPLNYTFVKPEEEEE